MNILLLYSSKTMRDITRIILRNFNIGINNIYISKTNKEALEICKTKKIDIILMDHNREEEDGLSMMRSLKYSKNLRDINVILNISGISVDVGEYYDIGIEGVLFKPFDENLLLKNIEVLMHNTEEKEEFLKQQKEYVYTFYNEQVNTQKKREVNEELAFLRERASKIGYKVIANNEYF